MRRSLLLLTLAACNSDWTITGDEPDEVVPDPIPPDVGSWLSMGVAPGGQLAIAYYDRDSTAYAFAVGTPSEDGTVAWATEQVDGYADPGSGMDSGDRGKYGSMKIAPDGTVWAAYWDATTKDLRYAHRTGGPKSWVTGRVDGVAGAVGEWASLALGADGRPVIAYFDADARALKVARLSDAQDESTPEYEWTAQTAWTGQAWSGTDAEGLPISRPAEVGRYARLMIDGGNEYIAYYDGAQQRLGLLEGNATNYTQSFISEEGKNAGQWPSMMVDGGTLIIAYHDVGNQDLIVSIRQAGGWVHEIADGADYVGADTEVFTRAGKTAVLYFDGQNNDMKLATKTGAAWVTETLGAADNAVGFHNEQVRVDDGFWTASYDFTTRQLFMYKLIDP
jgi:hypothetical protein